MTPRGRSPAGSPALVAAPGLQRGSSLRSSPWRAARVVALLALGLTASCSNGGDGSTAPPGDVDATEFWGYAGGLDRTYFFADETAIRPETAGRLVLKWRYLTGAVITSQIAVAEVDVAGEGRVKLVYASSWDGHLYALRARDGSLLWSFPYKPHPGASYPQASSPALADVAGRRVVFVGSGMTLYAVDAATGQELWEFDAGTGCTDCDFVTERNEILSTPAIFEGSVYFGMDINDFGQGKGGFYSLDAASGSLRWYFDLATSATCRPDAGDDVRRFDGYHTAAALGLPDDFFATRSGCNFDRRGNACGNVWSSAAIDPERRLLFLTSSNCDTDENPDTVEPPPPMPPFDEALFALTLDGDPAWVWRPREVDNDDFAWGAVPNLFSVEIGGETREVVGAGNKDGTYYLLDRDGENELTGKIEPYWSTQVVPGGDFGGVISTAAVGEGNVYFSTAIGTDIAAPQRPAAHALRAGDGSVLWQDEAALPSYGPTSAVPGLNFMGSIGGSLFVRDSRSGATLARLPLGGPVSSGAVVVDGELYIGAGTGARGGSPAAIAFQTSLIPSPVSVFCVSGEGDCPEGGSCDDANTCTLDERGSNGACVNQSLADGTACSVGTFPGQCIGGACVLQQAICEDQNQCTRDVVNGSSCRYELEPDGKICVIDDVAGQCESGRCVKLAPDDDGA